MPNRHAVDPKAWLETPREVLWTFSKTDRDQVIAMIVCAYTVEVNRRAEGITVIAGGHVGSHLSAIREINAELGLCIVRCKARTFSSAVSTDAPRLNPGGERVECRPLSLATRPA